MFYLWQPVMASPVIQQTKMEGPQTATDSCCWASTVPHTNGCLPDDWLLLYPPQV